MPIGGNFFIGKILSNKNKNLLLLKDNKQSGVNRMRKEREFFQIEEATITQIQILIKSGEISCVELVQMYLDRIQQLDQNGPSINSVLTINPKALDIAAEMDRLEDKTSVGPLFGIPVLLKDNIETKDEMPTTAGAIALKENFGTEDSWVAKKLREAGAIILGKTNMSEWAYFMSTSAPSGYSGLGGQVLNPYGPEDFPDGDVGGSSSGSGASIAANLAVVAIGTETSGSILSPASSNSIVGIKPTVGLISRTGIIPLALSQDTAGPMARTVTDAAITLGVLTGVDHNDAATAESEGKYLIDYTEHLKKDGLVGARIGIDYSYLSGNSEEKQILLEAIDVMQANGATVEEVAIPQHKLSADVLFYEFKHQINNYLKSTPDTVKVKTLKDVIEFNEKDPEIRMKHNQALLIELENKSEILENEGYKQARAKDIQCSRQLGIDKVMFEHNLDALLFVNNLGAALPAKAGYPSITVPAGYRNAGMPVGITFSSLAYCEPRLIELAYSFEQHSNKRISPRLGK